MWRISYCQQICHWLWWYGRWIKQEKDDSTCCVPGTVQGLWKQIWFFLSSILWLSQTAECLIIWIFLSVHSLLTLVLRLGIQQRENRMSSCLLDFRGVEKQQHAARSDDNLVLFDNFFMVTEHLWSYQCMQEVIKHKRSLRVTCCWLQLKLIKCLASSQLHP